VEPNETVILTLASGTGYTIGSPNAATGTITNDDVTNALVVGRHIFYNNSAFDGKNPAANTADFAAIAPHTSATDGAHPGMQLGKDALLPGQTATFANYTSYSKGINGIIVDIAGLTSPGTVTAANFGFKMGNTQTPSGWAAAPAPSVTWFAGAGVSGSDRYTLIWPDNAIQKQWLQVTVKSAGLGLPADDVFYFGNAIGEGGNSAADAYVTSADADLARANTHNYYNPAAITDPYDFDRDARVGAGDAVIVRYNGTDSTNALVLLSAPSPAPPPQAVDAVFGAPAPAGDEGPIATMNTLEWYDALDSTSSTSKKTKTSSTEVYDQALLEFAL